MDLAGPPGLQHGGLEQAIAALGSGPWREGDLSSLQLSHRDRRGPPLLLPGGCLSQPAWRQEAAADPQLPVSAGDDNPTLFFLRQLPTPWGNHADLSSAWVPPNRKSLLDAPEEDTNYLPLPEEQPEPLQQ